MPGFGHDSGDLHDLGILLLPAGSVPAGTPAVRLPRAGYLDQLKAAGTLKFRVADLVGYGVIPLWDLTGRLQFSFDGVRRSGTSTIIGLDNGEPALHPEPKRQRHRLGPLLRRLRLTPTRPRHAARPLRDERRQRAVQLEQPELPRRHAAGPGVPRPVPDAARRDDGGDGAASAPSPCCANIDRARPADEDGGMGAGASPTAGKRGRSSSRGRGSASRSASSSASQRTFRSRPKRAWCSALSQAGSCASWACSWKDREPGPLEPGSRNRSGEGGI